MKRNFEQVILKKLSGDIDIIDIRTSLGDLLYNSAMTIPVRKLAEKIYYSEGVTDFTLEELETLQKEVITNDYGLFLRIKDAVLELATVKDGE